jgi:hypothetical protein
MPRNTFERILSNLNRILVLYCVVEHSVANGVLPCITPFVLTPSSTLLISITLFAGRWHAIRYYVRGLQNIHYGGHNATILPILHTQVP